MNNEDDLIKAQQNLDKLKNQEKYYRYKQNGDSWKTTNEFENNLEGDILDDGSSPIQHLRFKKNDSNLKWENLDNIIKGDGNMNRGLYAITQLRYDISDMFDFGKGAYEHIDHFDNFRFKGYEYEPEYFKYDLGGESIKKTELTYEKIKEVISISLNSLVKKLVTLDDDGHLVENENNNPVKYTVRNPILKENDKKEVYEISIPFDIHKSELENGEIIFEMY